MSYTQSFLEKFSYTPPSAEKVTTSSQTRNGSYTANGSMMQVYMTSQYF